MSATVGRSRRSFLKQAGLTLMAGAGLAVATAAPAQAAVSFTCCPNTSYCGTGGCGSGTRRFRCYHSDTCLYCTGCQSGTACYQTTQPTCP